MGHLHLGHGFVFASIHVTFSALELTPRQTRNPAPESTSYSYCSRYKTSRGNVSTSLYPPPTLLMTQLCPAPPQCRKTERDMSASGSQGRLERMILCSFPSIQCKRDAHKLPISLPEESGFPSRFCTQVF
jgi:hypothetical protein